MYVGMFICSKEKQIKRMDNHLVVNIYNFAYRCYMKFHSNEYLVFFLNTLLYFVDGLVGWLVVA